MQLQDILDNEHERMLRGRAQETSQNAPRAVSSQQMNQMADARRLEQSDPIGNFSERFGQDLAGVPASIGHLADSLLSGETGPGEAGMGMLQDISNRWAHPVSSLYEHPGAMAMDVGAAAGIAGGVGGLLDRIPADLPTPEYSQAGGITSHLTVPEEAAAQDSFAANLQRLLGDETGGGEIGRTPPQGAESLWDALLKKPHHTPQGALTPEGNLLRDIFSQSDELMGPRQAPTMSEEAASTLEGQLSQRAGLEGQMRDFPGRGGAGSGPGTYEQDLYQGSPATGGEGGVAGPDIPYEPGWPRGNNQNISNEELRYGGQTQPYSTDYQETAVAPEISDKGGPIWERPVDVPSLDELLASRPPTEPFPGESPQVPAQNSLQALLEALLAEGTPEGYGRFVPSYQQSNPILDAFMQQALQTPYRGPGPFRG